MTDTPALTAEQRAAKAISALFIAQLETRDWLIASIASAIREAEQTNRIKAECYDACESVARNRLAHIPPDLEAEIPRLCGIEPRIWEQHRDRMPINAIDMLEHAKRKQLQERIAALESALTACVMQISEDAVAWDPERLPAVIEAKRVLPSLPPLT